MKRRDFSGQVLGASAVVAAGSGWVAPALAQDGPVEGKHYVRLAQPLPVSSNGKIEVLEFFWYGCPHCNTFEPMLESWTKQLPPDVAFRRVPVAFRDEPFVTHQKIYYALEAMGQLDAMHRKVFAAIHVDRQRLDKPADIAALMAKNGMDGAKFIETFNSFSVNTRALQARKLAEAYKIDGVPSIGIHGRYFTSATLAGTPERSLAVTGFLIQRSRTA